MTMRRRRPGGFTVIELLLGVVLAAFLALTAGGLLVFASRGWLCSASMSEMEHDMAVTLHALDMAVRGASNSNVVTGVNTLRVTAGGATKAFSRVGNSLYYNLNGTAGGELVVNNRLDSRSGMTGFMSRFTNAPNNEVFVTINLYDPTSGEALAVSNLCLRMRN